MIVLCKDWHYIIVDNDVVPLKLTFMPLENFLHCCNGSIFQLLIFCENNKFIKNEDLQKNAKYNVACHCNAINGVESAVNFLFLQSPTAVHTSLTETHLM
eukprot:TRINITY_DN8079_c0_g1_i1.p1 TRINITY_DN8079_c0_g1~~TRINITY_DN8079_c0_g1_i1.p1  ORF type:complete len:100 (+),score=3.73 TRINITY_DN8079_c0_g1_i1:464-763(+)